jgi:hypothetical protein
MLAYICIVVVHPIAKRGKVGIPYVVGFFFVFSNLRREVIVCFVNILIWLNCWQWLFKLFFHNVFVYSFKYFLLQQQVNKIIDLLFLDSVNETLLKLLPSVWISVPLDVSGDIFCLQNKYIIVIFSWNDFCC